MTTLKQDEIEWAWVEWYVCARLPPELSPYCEWWKGMERWNMWWFLCLHVFTDTCAWSWGMWDRYGYRVYVNSFCCILLYYYMYYCFVLCLDSGLYSCNMYVYSVIIAFIISCIKGCGVRRGRWNVSNQLQTRTLTPARRDAILKGDLPVCWPRGNVQIQFLNFADDCSACWQAPQMQTQRLVLIWMLPGNAGDSTGVVVW